MGSVVVVKVNPFDYFKVNTYYFDKSNKRNFLVINIDNYIGGIDVIVDNEQICWGFLDFDSNNYPLAKFADTPLWKKLEGIE